MKLKIKKYNPNSETRKNLLRKYLQSDFLYASDKDVATALRAFNSIKNALPKDFDDNMRYQAVRNKLRFLLNILDKQFVIHYLRGIVKQTDHPKLNALLVINHVVKIEKDLPVDIEYFKKLMKVKDD